MTISIIRQATPEDRQRVNAAARRFCQRHNVRILQVDSEVFGDSLENLVDFHILYGTSDPAEQSALQRKWSQAMCRALRVKYDRRVTLAYGHVGVSVD